MSLANAALRSTTSRLAKKNAGLARRFTVSAHAQQSEVGPTCYIDYTLIYMGI